MTDARLVIFDLDDTLVQNQAKYDAAKNAVASYIFDAFEPDAYKTPQDIVDDVIDAEDSDRYRATGVPETRFRDSCVHAVYEIAKQPDVNADAHIVNQAVKHAEQHGMAPLYEYSESDLLPGAVAALDYVEENGDDVAIMTKGSQDPQQIKLTATGLTGYETHIVDGKDGAFETVIGDREPCTVWKVGNSVRSDAHPALDFGAHTLIIADEDYTATWVGEKADNPLPEDGPWFRQDNLIDFKAAYDVMTAFDETGDVDLLKEHR